MDNKTYIAIDLKSYYASVECAMRRLDPLTTNLVVADASRTDKTICLAVSPSLKSYGISSRARLFEVIQRVKEVNALKKSKAPGRVLTSYSYNDLEVKSSPNIGLDYIAAPPRMAYYIEYSTMIYDIYLKYIAPEDIHVYSIDEVFIDATNYLNSYKISAYDLTSKIILDVREKTGVTAAAGIGTNLYLAKVAMDIQAKKSPIDENRLQIAQLDEISYRKLLWSHRPLTDFWRIGRGYSRKLEKHGIFTMGDIARCSLGKETDFHNEDLLYKLFGVNAELLIDHAWGWEPCTIADIKAYKPKSNSMGSGQVLHHPYSFEKAKLIAKEMADLLVLDLVDKGLVTDQIVLTLGYDNTNLTDDRIKNLYKGPVTIDGYGRRRPKSAHATINLGRKTSSSKLIMDAVVDLFEDIVDRNLLVRKVSITANNVVDELSLQEKDKVEQLDFFTDYSDLKKKEDEEQDKLQREKRMQKTIIEIKHKYGKNSILRGMNLEDGATSLERNKQIGGHKA